VLMGLMSAMAYPRLEGFVLAYERDAQVDLLQNYLTQLSLKAKAAEQKKILPQGLIFRVEQDVATDRLITDIIQTPPEDDTSSTFNQNSADIASYSEQAASKGKLVFLVNEDIRINSRGACQAGVLSVVLGDAQKTYHMTRPFCRLALDGKVSSDD